MVTGFGTVDDAAGNKTALVARQSKLGSGVIGQPMTYVGPDKRQYVAVYSGVGGDMAGDPATAMDGELVWLLRVGTTTSRPTKSCGATSWWGRCGIRAPSSP